MDKLPSTYLLIHNTLFCYQIAKYIIREGDGDGDGYDYDNNNNEDKKDNIDKMYFCNILVVKLLFFFFILVLLPPILQFSVVSCQRESSSIVTHKPRLYGLCMGSR